MWQKIKGVKKLSIEVTQGYCPRSGNNTLVTVGDLRVYFSYSTPVAFRLDGNLVIRQNDWSTTTGKHLNAISENKKDRISGEKFEDLYRKALEKLGLKGDFI